MAVTFDKKTWKNQPICDQSTSTAVYKNTDKKYENICFSLFHECTSKEQKTILIARMVMPYIWENENWWSDN